MAGKGENGGVSVSPPALGADADDGGDSDRTGDGSSASGFGIDYIVGKVANGEYFSMFFDIRLSTLTGKVSVYQPDIPQNSSSYEFQPQDHASGNRVKRSPKITTYVSSRKRQDISDIIDGGDDEEEDDGSTDENSGRSGSDSVLKLRSLTYRNRSRWSRRAKYQGNRDRRPWTLRRARACRIPWIVGGRSCLQLPRRV